MSLSTGQLAVILGQEFVQTMGFVWNEIHFETGIDGVAEIVDTACHPGASHVGLYDTVVARE